MAPSRSEIFLFTGVREMPGTIDGTVDMSTAAFQSNVLEKGELGILIFLLGVSRDGGGLEHLAQL